MKPSTPSVVARLATRALFGLSLLCLAGLSSAAKLAAAPAIRCDGDGASARCVFEVTSGLAFEASYANTLDFGTGYRLAGDVVLRTPARDFHLADADLVFAPTDTPPYVELYGVARAPLGDLPILGDASIGVSPIVAIGLVTRSTLTELVGDDLPLANVPGADPSYLFFHFATGLELDLGLAELLGLNTEPGAHDPFEYEFPGDTTLTMIIDPSDPYFYLSSDARKLALDKLQDKAELARARYEAYKEQQAEQENEGDGGEGDDGDGKKKDKKEKKDKKPNDKSDKKKKDKKDDSGGIDLGSVAFSGHGGIPFAPATVWGLPAGVGGFDGHLFLEATIPLGYGVSISGPVVAYLGSEGVELGGNGHVAIGAGLVGDIVGLEFDLGDASAGVALRQGRAMTYFSGVLEPDTSFLPPSVPIVPAASVRVAAYVDSARPLDTRLAIEGQFDVGADKLGRLLGIDLSKALEIDGELVIDASGYRLTGTTRSSIHKDLAFSGEALVDVWFSATQPESSYIIMNGHLAVGGVDLSAGAAVELSSRGLFIDGSFVTAISEVEMHGEVTSSGPLVEGRFAVDFGLDGINKAVEKARADIAAAQAKVDGLDRQIAAARDIVKAERAEGEAKVNAARQKVAAAAGEVSSLQSKVDANYREIDKRRKEIRDWKKWYDRKPWYEKATAWTRYLAEKAWRETEIAGRYTAIGGLKASMLVANEALKVAQAALRAVEAGVAAFPIDADPRVAGLITARAAALAALQIAAAALGGFPSVGGQFVGEITVTISRRGADGSVIATLDGKTLAGGSVELGRDPKACIEVAGMGNVCVEL